MSERLRQAIAAAVKELDYVPDLNARALASSRTDIVGVLVPSLLHTIFTDVLRGIYDGASDTPFQIQIGNTRNDPQEEERLISGFIRQKPAGLIVSGIDQVPASRRMLEQAGCPVVQIMDITDDPIDRIIGFSHVEAGRLMTEHLVAQGYRRIAFLGGWTNRRSRGRLVGYRQALAAAGLPEPYSLQLHAAEDRNAFESIATWAERPFLEHSDPGFGRELFRIALGKAPDIDAVFCNNDSFALGVLFECIERGLRVPQDIGIGGFNDLDFAKATYPQLTSVRTHRYRIGNAAVAAIRDEIAGSGSQPRIQDLGTEVIARRSTDRNGHLPG